jgi:hypothetical protein
MPTLQALASLTGGLWNTGNLWARWAIGLIAGWPPILAIVALLNVPTLTSLLGLVPLATVVFVLVAWSDPLVIPVLAITQYGRTGLQWVSTVIAGELLLGVYFALVPVSNDPALVPLLLLVGACLTFLSMGAQFPAKPALQFALVALVALMTLAFIAGGREAAHQWIVSLPRH